MGRQVELGAGVADVLDDGEAVDDLGVDNEEALVVDEEVALEGLGIGEEETLDDLGIDEEETDLEVEQVDVDLADDGCEDVEDLMLEELLVIDGDLNVLAFELFIGKEVEVELGGEDVVDVDFKVLLDVDIVVEDGFAAEVDIEDDLNTELVVDEEDDLGTEVEVEVPESRANCSFGSVHPAQYVAPKQFTFSS